MCLVTGLLWYSGGSFSGRCAQSLSSTQGHGSRKQHLPCRDVASQLLELSAEFRLEQVDVHCNVFRSGSTEDKLSCKIQETSQFIQSHLKESSFDLPVLTKRSKALKLTSHWEAKVLVYRKVRSCCLCQCETAVVNKRQMSQHCN